MNKKPKQNNNDEIPSNQQQNLNQTQHVQNASLQGHEDTSSFSNSVTANFEYDFELFGSPYSSNVIPDFMDADLALALELFLDNNCLGPNSTANSSHVDNEDEDEEC
ncbi:uncharacterized protein GO595_003271 [Histomonas meleagridis]|uniref:uncharacterized protein n=1 Tax=Histomonas meleagridis TaxID=135588 RepID=UPI00355989B1|nr:hypothetical protein GO595_003271 [Histomonas meleagridis]